MKQRPAEHVNTDTGGSSDTHTHIQTHTVRESEGGRSRTRGEIEADTTRTQRKVNENIRKTDLMV